MTVSVRGTLRVSGTMLAGWAVSHRVMPASPAAFVMNGQAATLSLNAVFALSAAQGAVAFSGQAVGLTRTGTRTLVAGQGAFTLTGRTVILKRARKMSAAQGSLSFTGQAATLTHTLTGAWPDATNTGHTGTLTLSSGNLTSTSNGQIIQNLNVTGTITVNHSNVTVRNCQAQLIVAIGASASGCIIEDCTVVGTGAMEKTGIVTGYTLATIIRRNDISGVEEGVYVAFGATVRDNWIHDLASPGDPVPEINGITCQGGVSGTLIEHNTIDIGNPTQATVFLSSDYAAVANVVVNNNKLLGGDYCVVSQGTAFPASGVSFTNNRMDDWVTAPFYASNNFVSWAGNVDYSSSAVIPGPGTPVVTVGTITLAGQAATLTYSGSASSSEWPDATNTGYTGSLTVVGTVFTSSNNQTIQNQQIEELKVVHSNVTIRNCKIKHIALTAVNLGVVLIEDCHVDGNDRQYWNNCIGPDATENTPGGSVSLTIRRCNIQGSELGIVTDEMNNVLIEDNYIHHLIATTNPDPHYDGIQVNTSDNMIIRHNTLDHDEGTSSPITMYNGSNGLLEDNLFGGGGYSIYFNGTTSGWTCQNNWFRWVKYGWVGFQAENQTWIQNRYGTGAPQDGVPPSGNAGQGTRPTPFP